MWCMVVKTATINWDLSDSMLNTLQSSWQLERLLRVQNVVILSAFEAFTKLLTRQAKGRTAEPVHHAQALYCMCAPFLPVLLKHVSTLHCCLQLLSARWKLISVMTTCNICVPKMPGAGFTFQVQWRAQRPLEK